jgi:hypothetical protein
LGGRRYRRGGVCGAHGGVECRGRVGRKAKEEGMKVYVLIIGHFYEPGDETRVFDTFDHAKEAIEAGFTLIKTEDLIYAENDSQRLWLTINSHEVEGV